MIGEGLEVVGVYLARTPRGKGAAAGPFPHAMSAARRAPRRTPLALGAVPGLPVLLASVVPERVRLRVLLASVVSEHVRPGRGRSLGVQLSQVLRLVRP
jgi:hypothetical protein